MLQKNKSFIEVFSPKKGSEKKTLKEEKYDDKVKDDIFQKER